MPVFSGGSFGGPNVLLDGVYSFNPYKPRSLFVEHRHANSADPESNVWLPREKVLSKYD